MARRISVADRRDGCIADGCRDRFDDSSSGRLY
jgi:hypothetical protein